MIRVENVYKTYKNGRQNTTVLHGINMRVQSGQFAILKGVSGSGKSTLLSLIAGFEKPNSGTVYIHSDPISKLPDIHQSKIRNEAIGFVFQSYELFEDLSVKDNVFIPTVVYPRQNRANENAVLQALQKAKIAHKAEEKVKNLSGGEKQRCAVARALVNDPDIIICDEPTANLDHANSIALLELLEELKAFKKTLLIATHDPLFDTLECVDTRLSMHDGKLKQP